MPCFASNAFPAARRTLYSTAVRSPHWYRYSPAPGQGSADRAPARPGRLQTLSVLACRGGRATASLRLAVGASSHWGRPTVQVRQLLQSGRSTAQRILGAGSQVNPFVSAAPRMLTLSSGLPYSAMGVSDWAAGCLRCRAQPVVAHGTASELAAERLRGHAARWPFRAVARAAASHVVISAEQGVDGHAITAAVAGGRE